jgi:uncharacterized phage-associated protein
VLGEGTMGDIQFEFNLDKLIHTIAYFCHQNVDGLTKLKVAKMLYFADKKHLLEFGAPIIGDVYFCMEFGPVPSFALNEMNEAINRSEVVCSGCSDYSKMSLVLRVKRSLFSKYPHFEAKQDFDASVFAQSEIDVLRYVAQEYGRRSAKQLVDLTHNEPTWRIANELRGPNSRTPIPYELFFEGAPQESRKHLARLKAEFCGEAIEMPGDPEYRAFAGEMASYDFEPSLELDKDQIRRRGVSHSA